MSEGSSMVSPEDAVGVMEELWGPEAGGSGDDPGGLPTLRDEELRLAQGAGGSCIDPTGVPLNSGTGADPYGGG